MAHSVRTLLHPRVADQVIAILPIPFETAEREIASATSEVATGYERESDLAAVNEVINRAKSGGRGALGSDAVNRALDLQAVSLLVLPYPMDPARANELIIKAVRSSGKIDFVYGEAADRLDAEGGIGALLYYAISSESASV